MKKPVAKPIPREVLTRYARAFMREDLDALRAIMDANPSLDLGNPELTGGQKTGLKPIDNLARALFHQYPLELLEEGRNPERLQPFAPEFIFGYIALIAGRNFNFLAAANSTGNTLVELAWESINPHYGAAIILEHLRANPNYQPNFNTVLCSVKDGAYRDEPGTSMRGDTMKRILKVQRALRAALNRPRSEHNRQLAKTLGRNSFFRRVPGDVVADHRHYAKPSAKVLALRDRLQQLDALSNAGTLDDILVNSLGRSKDVLNREIRDTHQQLLRHQRAALLYYRDNPGATALPDDFTVPGDEKPAPGADSALPLRNPGPQPGKPPRFTPGGENLN